MGILRSPFPLGIVSIPRRVPNAWFGKLGCLLFAENRGGKYGTIEMTIKPTAEQKRKLRSFINAVGGNVDIDFMDENYNTTHSVSYEGVSPTRALSGITTFYDKGIKPKGNVSYSINREDIDAERTEIEHKAKADDTWLKAPNGKDTNLSPKQWVDVRTKAFKEWFGDWENYDIRYSISRDEVTVATPEMVAEANEELSREAELVEQLDEAQTALDRLRSKIAKRNQRKEMTFDEVRKFLLDDYFRPIFHV